jgi:outer membrane protein assembly factor BamE (lipoprotein component of BamABCDE complex)
MARTIHALLAASLLAGCASYSGYGLKPGVSTEAEVRTTMGAPAAEFTQGDGSRRLVYPRGPLGTRTFMADVGPDRRLTAVTQVLDDDTFHRIQPGQTREDVLRTIGPPGQSMGFPRTGHTAWDYRYTDTWGYLAIFSVTFDRDGIVVSKFTQRVERDRPAH